MKVMFHREDRYLPTSSCQQQAPSNSSPHLSTHPRRRRARSAGRGGGAGPPAAEHPAAARWRHPQVLPQRRRQQHAGGPAPRQLPTLSRPLLCTVARSRQVAGDGSSWQRVLLLALPGLLAWGPLPSEGRSVTTVGGPGRRQCRVGPPAGANHAHEARHPAGRRAALRAARNRALLRPRGRRHACARRRRNKQRPGGRWQRRLGTLLGGAGAGRVQRRHRPGPSPAAAAPPPAGAASEAAGALPGLFCWIGCPCGADWSSAAGPGRCTASRVVCGATVLHLHYPRSPQP